MALGTSHPRSGGGRHGKAVEKSLRDHAELMAAYQAAGMDRLAASSLAYKEIMGRAAKKKPKPPKVTGA